MKLQNEDISSGVFIPLYNMFFSGAISAKHSRENLVYAALNITSVPYSILTTVSACVSLALLADCLEKLI